MDSSHILWFVQIFYCPTRVREFFFSKFALSSSLLTSVILQKGVQCYAPMSCKTLLNLQSRDWSLTWQRWINCPSSNGMLLSSCCRSWDDVTIGNVTVRATHHDKSNQKRILILSARWKEIRGLNNFFVSLHSAYCSQIVVSDTIKSHSVREKKELRGTVLWGEVALLKKR